MPTPSSTFTQLVTTTLRGVVKKEIADNVSQNNALYRHLKKRGNIVMKGGYEIQTPIEYADNSGFSRITGYGAFNVAASDVFTSAKYNTVEYVVPIVSSGQELRANRGKEQMFDLVKAKKKNAVNTASNQMNIDLYSDGSSANQMGGLAHIIQSAGTGTVGGINAGTWSFWQNKVREASGTNTISKTTIRGEMNNLYMQLTRGGDKPDVIVASQDFYNMYWESLTELQRYTSADDEATAGFMSLKFNGGTNVIFDSNTNFGTTAETMYFLNTKYLYLVEMEGAQWEADKERVSYNQDATLVPLIWEGQLVCSNRALQGKLIDAA